MPWIASACMGDTVFVYVVFNIRIIRTGWTTYRNGMSAVFGLTIPRMHTNFGTEVK